MIRIFPYFFDCPNFKSVQRISFYEQKLIDIHLFRSMLVGITAVRISKETVFLFCWSW